MKEPWVHVYSGFNLTTIGVVFRHPKLLSERIVHSNRLANTKLRKKPSVYEFTTPFCIDFLMESMDAMG